MAAFDASFGDLEEKNEALSGLIEAHSAKTRSDGEAAVATGAWLLIGGILLVCCLLCLLTTQLMKAVLRPLEKIIGVARNIAQGNLRQMIDGIRQEGEQLQQTARSLNGASQSIVRSTTEESQSASSTAGAMEQMMQNIEQIAGHARNAQEISSHSEHLASNGGQVIMGVVTA